MVNINADVILKIADSGSFKKAAADLGYTQAGISYIVKAMEADLGIQLFHRSYGGASLTREGQQILPYARQIANAQRGLLNKASELKDLSSGFVKVAAIESLIIHWIPGILEMLHRDHPGIEFEFITCENQHQMKELVLSGDVDLGFFSMDLKGIRLLELIEEPMLAILSPAHELASGSSFPVERIADYPYIATTSDYDSELADIFDLFGVYPKSKITTDSDYSSMAMASRNLGYAVFSETAIAGFPLPHVTLPFSQPVTRKIYLGARSFEELSGAAGKFVECTRKWLADR